jgi:hypothetical protein
MNQFIPNNSKQLFRSACKEEANDTISVTTYFDKSIEKNIIFWSDILNAFNGISLQDFQNKGLTFEKGDDQKE